MTAIKLVISFVLLGSVKARSIDPGRMTNVLMGEDDIMRGDMCQDCTQIFELLKDLMSKEDFQAKLTTTLEHLCDKLPAQATKICHDEVEKTLPLAISFLTNMLKPEEICTYLGLCGGRDNGMMRELLLNHIYKTVSVPTMKLEVSVQCSVCTYIVRTVEYLFPKEKAQSVITALLESLCTEFPTLVQSQCNTIVEKYVQLLIDMLLNSSSPNFICNLLRFCEILEMPFKERVLSDCDSCLTLAILTRMHLGSNATESQTASFVDSVCQLHPTAIPKCEIYTQRHGNQLSMFLGKEKEALDICKRANLCVAPEKELVMAGDPCSFSPNYRCKDLQTALECGAVSFCQMNVWG
ncbi:prosaposin isoform X2 [Myxocyprinus asiaticus]|uniref:prosaposin isoform X2 n=1 Tax=Myxocyprinus asiaticus TaxID=70543 RepID=UPI0022220174|nr:prosaposin isoform X2 [Myxocyprinus asiaticus]